MIATLCFALLLSHSVVAQMAPGTPNSRDTFVLSGTVVNSVTGEPIAHAVVRTNGVPARTAFTDSEGYFQIENMPAMQVNLTAQKPGYFSEQETGTGPVRMVQIGPNTGSQTIKLAPQSAIQGRVADIAGQPVEHIAVRLVARSLREGRKHWESHGMTETDEDGYFRFANLMPGTYYLSVGPSQSENQILAEGQKPTTGFPHLYYPGSPDLNSAAPLQLTPGQQAEADFSLTPVPMYHVSGSVSGQEPEHGVGIMVLTSAGDQLLLPSRFNTELGTFSIDSIPAGTYVLKAVSQSGSQPSRAELQLNVSSNMESVHLTLGPAMSIPVIVHLQSKSSSNSSASPWSEDRPPLTVSLVPDQPNGTEAFSTLQRRSGRNVMSIPNVESGSYNVSLRPQPPWYVQSATYGQSNALYDNINIASGPIYPLDVTLRDDSATLTVTIRGSENAGNTGATVVVIPQPASNVAPQVQQAVRGTYTENGLAPGEYLVFAFDRSSGLEYSNPDALQPYMSQAAHVTLTANQSSQVAVDLIQLGKGD